MRRRVAHPILRFFRTVSLVLLVGVCAMWVRSNFAVDTYPMLTRNETLVYPMSHNNQFQLIVMRDWNNLEPAAYHGDPKRFRDWGRFSPAAPSGLQPGRQPESWSYLMASINGWSGDVPGWHTLPGSPPMPSWGVIIDYWVLAVLAGLLPAAVALHRVWRRIAERRRRNVGLCPACGYDLRATPDRCPECGASPTPAKKTYAAA